MTIESTLHTDSPRRRRPGRRGGRKPAPVEDSLDLFSPQANLESELRRCTGLYLAARERYEDHGDAVAWEYAQATNAAAMALVAAGDAPDIEGAYAALESLTAPWSAEMLVERWVGLHGNDLDYRPIICVADQIRDRIAEGTPLSDIDITGLIAAYTEDGA
jgi:hypothetical protein